MSRHPHRARMRRCISRLSRRKGVYDPAAVCARAIMAHRKKNPADIKRGDWVILKAGEIAGHYPSKQFPDETGMKEIAQGFAQNLNHQVILMRSGSTYVHAVCEPTDPPAAIEPRDNITRAEWQRMREKILAGRAAKTNALRYKAVQQPSGEYHIIDTETGEQVRTAKTRSAALQIVTSMNAKALARERRSNPAEAAGALSAAFHGRDQADEVIEIVDTRHEHEHLSEFGRLEQLHLLDERGRCNCGDKKCPRGSKGRGNGPDVKFDRNTHLASSENGRQLFIEGGDQRVKLAQFGLKDRGKEIVPLGTISAVVYQTAKHHLGPQDKQTGSYIHHFEEPLPELIYRPLDPKLEFSGGRYLVERDIDGKFSAGIKG